MADSLYDMLIAAENLADKFLPQAEVDFRRNLEKIEDRYPDLQKFSDKVEVIGIPKINIPEFQKEIMGRYEKNPIFSDAIKGNISVEDSLLELDWTVNRPVRRLFPMRKNNAHNERVKQIGELVGTPYHLMTNGIFSNNNFVYGIMQIGTAAYLISYVFASSLKNSWSITGPMSAQEYFFKMVFPAGFNLTLGPVVGWVHQMSRSGYLPLKEAQYIDAKVNDLYK